MFVAQLEPSSRVPQLALPTSTYSTMLCRLGTVWACDLAIVSATSLHFFIALVRVIYLTLNICRLLTFGVMSRIRHWKPSSLGPWRLGHLPICRV